MAVNHALLRSHWQLMKQATANDLYAGLPALSHSLQRHLRNSNLNDAATNLFQTIYHQSYPTKATAGEEIEPGDLIFQSRKRTAEEVEAGKRLFEAFAERFKPTICSQQGVMGMLLKGMVNTEEMPLLLATHIINNHFANREEWYAVSLVIASLIDKQGVENFCL